MIRVDFSDQYVSDDRILKSTNLLIETVRFKNSNC